MKRDYRLYFDDILESINRIKAYIKGITLEEFLRNDLIFDAVIRNLEVIGEAANKVPDSIKEEYAMIPWQRMVGLRNVLIHEYFGVDREIVWKIVSEDLPKTIVLIEKVKNKI